VPVTPPLGEMHEVLSVDVQLMVEVAPPAIEDGDAVRVTVGTGAAATATVVVWLVVPPGPVHVTVKVVLVVSEGVVNEPVVPVPPPPDEVHDALLVDDQVILEVAPFWIEDGVAVSATTGAAVTTLIVVLWLVVPPGPVHVTV
jgi:hypothetical protein